MLVGLQTVYGTVDMHSPAVSCRGFTISSYCLSPGDRPPCILSGSYTGGTEARSPQPLWRTSSVQRYVRVTGVPVCVNNDDNDEEIEQGKKRRRKKQEG